MKSIFLALVVFTLLQIGVLVIVVFLNKRFSKAQIPFLCVPIVIYLGQGFLMRYILTIVPNIRNDMGEFFSAFFQDWYFVLFSVVILLGFLFLYLSKRQDLE